MENFDQKFAFSARASPSNLSYIGAESPFEKIYGPPAKNGDPKIVQRGDLAKSTDVSSHESKTWPVIFDTNKQFLKIFILTCALNEESFLSSPV